MTTTADVRLFAYRQGPLRPVLAEQPQGSDTEPTTATLPPVRARGAEGRPLPAGTHRLPAGAPYPRPLPPEALAALAPGDQAGHLLVAAEEECALLVEQSRDDSVLEACEVTAPLAGLSGAAAEPVRSMPEPAGGEVATVRPDWAETLWNRSAGRTSAAVVGGFSARPAVLGEDCLLDMLAWLDRPAPGPLLAEVGRRVRTSVALQRMAGLPTGRYAVVKGGVESEQPEPGLMQRFADAFGYPLSPTLDCGLRHANALWVFSADLDAILAEFGPAGWSLLQFWCGWATHGLAVAAAAHGLFARPARSFNEIWLQRTLGLPRAVFPVFTVTCGRSRFIEPMLDLRV